MRKGWTSYFFLVTLTFFTLGFININLAWLGLACLILPFVLLFKNKKKTWCQNYCPRSYLFSFLFQGRSFTGRSGPDWLVKGNGKWILLVYFCVNLLIITMSTIRVSMDLMEPMERVRFLIAFVLPWEMPQLLSLGPMPDWVVHLSYRIYSMMFTTTVLGLILGSLYYSRAWCRVCPINTLSDLSLPKLRTEDASTAVSE